MHSKRFSFAPLLSTPLLLFACSNDEPKVSVDIEISNQLPAERFSSNWPVHIFLSTPGSAVPLSTTTVTLADLPYSTTLTEKNYVLPNYTLEGHEQLVLVTKVSSSGDPHRSGSEDFRQQSAIFRLNANKRAKIAMVLKPKP